MRRLRLPVVALLLVFPFVACQGETAEQEGATTETVEGTGAEELPVTTASDEARTHYLAGQRALDMGDVDGARAHFEEAIAADPEFAMAYYGLASSANSFESFKENMELASEKAAGASEAERAQIDQMRAGFEDDAEGEQAAATRLTELAPNSPRAWMALAAVQSNMNDEAAARESLKKAAEIDPEFAPAHMALGNSYMFVEPIDLAEAQTHIERAAELEPDEAIVHDLLGDVHRAQGNLQKAAEEYGRTAELDPESGNGYQQRGHVHTFLGNWEQARADYDQAIEIESGKNAAAQFGVYRALVSVHEGNPEAAVDELESLVSEIEGMDIPNTRGPRIFALNTLAAIALHNGMLERAEAAIEKRNALLDENVQIAGTPAAERNVEAQKTVARGWLAAHRGDYDEAASAAEEAQATLGPGGDPDRFEGVHELLGFVALERGNHQEAIEHLEQADADDLHVVYLHARALEAAGEAEKANELYTKIAEWRFNDPDLALVRAEAQRKVGG
ncbi:MAG: tetratricopeptide repeat protein [Gemmatimonadota bacterium]|nr:tetratricopeptide repeat protein [Gemmatimonadota bacterium]